MSLTPKQELEMYADIKVIKNKLENDCRSLGNHEERIAKLEKSYNWLAGVATGAGAVTGAIASFFINVFMR